MENRRVGILGGSFDPPTIAHEQLGEIFIEALALDEVRYVVARQNPLKINEAIGSAKHRWLMLLMMIQGHEKFSASDIEVQGEFEFGAGGKLVPADEESKSYAYNTLRAFKMMEPHNEFIFLGGSDILRNFYKWHKSEHLIKEFRIGIAIRPPHSIASTIAPIKAEHRDKVTIFDRPAMPDMSSTDVRSFFENGKLDRAKSLMRSDIYEYVLGERIYDIPQEIPVKV